MNQKCGQYFSQYNINIYNYSEEISIDKNSIRYAFNPLTSPGKVVTVFTYPYLSAGAPALVEAKGLINQKTPNQIWFIIWKIFMIIKIKTKMIMNF